MAQGSWDLSGDEGGDGKDADVVPIERVRDDGRILNGKRGRPRGSAWDLADHSGYGIEKFYTGSKTDGGEVERVTIRIAESQWAQVCALSYNKKIPAYKTPQDFVRDAIVHRMKWLNDQGGVLDEETVQWLNLEIRKSSAERMMKMMQANHDVVVRYEEMLNDAVRRKDWGMFEFAVDQMDGVVEELKDPYKGNLVDVWKQAEDAAKRAGWKG